ncbi:MAG: DUF6144 family protein [Anaerolineales bacterium]
MSTNPSSQNQEPKIPISGRLGRIAKFIEEESGRDILMAVMADYKKYESTSSQAKKADWVRHMIARLEKMVGEKTSLKIMEACGRKCCGLTTRKNAEKFMRESDSLEQFVATLNEHGIGGGRLRITQKGDITGGYDHCYCGLVKHTTEPFPTKTYCQCSVGWYKQLFETGLDRPVDVQIIQSLITCANSCEFMIHI